MKILTTLIASLLLVTGLTYGQLGNQYSKFLILKSEQIDYYPVWGDSDNTIYININSKEWRKYDLSKIEIKVALYYNDTLAINTNDNYSIISDTKLIQQFKSNKSWDFRKITDKSNRTFFLKENGFNTEFSISEEKIMDIQGNAHSISISPSGKYVACIFEQTGLVIFDIAKELATIQNKNNLLLNMTKVEKAEYFFNNNDDVSLENVLETFSKREKRADGYHYYFGLLSYIKAEHDNKNIDIAIKHLSKVSTKPKFYVSNIYICSILQNTGKWEESLEYADKSIKYLSDDPTGYTLKAQYFENKGDANEACNYYKQAYNKGDIYVKAKLEICD